MSLPFSNDNKTRKWTCFCCGKQFLFAQEYKDHILQDHAAEEGREFIICPLARCGFPVRCVRTHFRAKHKSEKEIPKTGQMKALIWKDHSTRTGKLKQRKPKFREGYLVSAKNGGKEMHYRSGYECEVYECLECLPEIVKYDVEPFAIKYSFEGEVHEYNPDLSILFNDGHVEIWEIKPANQTSLPKNTAKWSACQQHCEVRGWNFMVMTEKGIGKLKTQAKENRKN